MVLTRYFSGSWSLAHLSSFSPTRRRRPNSGVHLDSSTHSTDNMTVSPSSGMAAGPSIQSIEHSRHRSSKREIPIPT